eukprot:gene3856-4816_t
MATAMLRTLPTPVNRQPEEFTADDIAPVVAAIVPKGKTVPPYGKRHGFTPRRPDDFADGGAFPEIHVAQYPLGMGKGDDKSAGNNSTAVVPVSVNEKGEVNYDAIMKQGGRSNKIVHTGHEELLPKMHLQTEESLVRPDEEEVEETKRRTMEAITGIVDFKLQAAQPKTLAPVPGAPTYIKYTPNQQGDAFNSGAKHRVIRMSSMPTDPLEPPRFRHKKVPRGPGSPPVPVLHSPPRAVSSKDQADWKIPPCISNWKNNKGYTIPLDKRLAADGRGLQETQINDNFAKLSEALYVAEEKARAAVKMRADIQKELLQKDKEKQEDELRALAQRARMERAGGAAERSVEARVPVASGGDREIAEDREDREASRRRDELREERRRERERERRIEERGGNAKKSKLSRDRDRDIGEQIALGQANVTGGARGETMYDQRLFNQEEGVASGFGGDDQYTVYDKALFADKGSGLYKSSGANDEETYGGSGEGEKEVKTDRFQPDRGFAGAGKSGGPRDKPVEFEKDAEEADPFGLEQFLTDMDGK